VALNAKNHELKYFVFLQFLAVLVEMTSLNQCVLTLTPTADYK